MKSLKMKPNNMNSKKINKEYRKFLSSTFNYCSSPQRFKDGIIYTLFSYKLNLLEVGFVENDKVLKDRLCRNGFILLDKKKGKVKDLNLLINTLNEFGIKYEYDLNYKYSNTLMRHLSTLGWPVGRSLHKQRRIKKELSFA